jgi:hypothetical protein
MTTSDDSQLTFPSNVSGSGGGGGDGGSSGSSMTKLTMKELLNIEDFHRAAKAKLPRMVYDYYASGSNDMVTLKRNRTAFEGWILRPRVLVDVSKQDLSTTVLGLPVSFPILIAPTAMQSGFPPSLLDILI